MKKILEKITFFNEAKFIRNIEEGWSYDEKYLYLINNRKCIVRVRKSTMESYERKVRIFEELNSVDTAIPQIVFSDYIDGYQIVVLEWLEGKPLLDNISEFSKEEQYQLGLSAGRALRLIHSTNAPSNEILWENRFSSKIERVLNSYVGEYSFEGDHYLIDYIDRHKHLLKGIKSVLQHGDFHMGNMIVNGNEISIIDLDRSDYGCPIEEYNRFYFTSKASKYFALGQVTGYAIDNLEEFFELMKLYLSVNILSTFSWATNFGEAELKTSFYYSKYVLEQYDNLRAKYPKWYQEAKKEQVTFE